MVHIIDFNSTSSFNLIDSQEWFYGDAISAKNCVECECNPQACLEKPIFTFQPSFLKSSQSNRLTLQFRERSGATISPANASASQALRFISEKKVENAKHNFQGRNCDQCQADHWGFASGTGCYPCECSDASEHGQCDQVIQ